MNSGVEKRSERDCVTVKIDSRLPFKTVQYEMVGMLRTVGNCFSPHTAAIPPVTA